MNIRDRRAIHQRSRQVLAQAPGDPRRVALVYTVITAVLALAVTVLSGIFTDRIAGTGGLGNMGLRSLLSTGQTVLPIAQFFVNACLGFGYHWAVLRMARGEEALPGDLAMGFRNWGAVLRLLFFQSVVYAVIGFGSMYLSIYIFLLTPYADPFYAVMEPVLQNTSLLNSSIVVDEAMAAAVYDSILPVFLIWALVFAVFGLPLYYNYRMSNFCLAEDPRRGALAAMIVSKRMLRRNRFALFRLDLSLWWFYGLQILISLLCYGDVLLPMVGVRLPFDAAFTYYFFFVASLILQIVTYYFFMNRAYVTYALAYQSLKEPPQATEVTRQPPFPTEF